MGLDRRTHDSLDRQRNFCPHSNHLVIRLRLAPEARSLEIIDPPYFEGFERGAASRRLERNKNVVRDGGLG